jgi:hypothetical protein
VLDLFPTPWLDLSLPVLKAFLSSAEPEPLQWEAKGTNLDAHAVRKAANAFANSVDGGFLILGADEDKKAADRSCRWTVAGMQFPDDPKLWIVATIKDGLRPVPAIDIVTFDADEGGHVAVVWVPPIDDPPCVNRGTVYERLPGRSEPVKDPLRLAALYARGQRARDTALSNSVTSATSLIGGRLALPDAKTGTVRFSVAVCHVAHTHADIASRLFRASFTQELQQVLRPLVQGGPVAGRLSGAMSQDAVTAQGVDAFGEKAWDIRASWDGAVAVCFDSLADSSTHPESLAQSISSAWTTALQLAEKLGGQGDHFAAVRLSGRELVRSVQDQRDPTELPLLTRGPQLSAPSQDTTEHLAREIARIAGQRAYEPE